MEALNIAYTFVVALLLGVGEGPHQLHYTLANGDEGIRRGYESQMMCMTAPEYDKSLPQDIRTWICRPDSER